jgi:hypothetical protein
MDATALKIRLENIARELAAMRALLEEEAGEFPAWAQELVDQQICLDCRKKIHPKDPQTRGNHATCARRITRRIDAGELTDAEAVRNGLLAPRKSPGPKADAKPSNSRLAQYLASRDQPRDPDTVAKKFHEKKKELAAKKKPSPKPATKPIE